MNDASARAYGSKQTAMDQKVARFDKLRALIHIRVWFGDEKFYKNHSSLECNSDLESNT